MNALILAVARVHLALAAAACLAAPAFGEVDPAAELAGLRARVAALEAKRSESWLNTERTAQIRQIASEVLADSQSRGQFLDNAPVQFGYNNGIFIQSAEPRPNYKLTITGFVQLRYTYAHSEVPNGAGYGSNIPAHGDINGLDFRRLRLYFLGNIIDPNLTYVLSGDFAGSASNTGSFQALDLYVGYKFSEYFAIRAGSFLVPFTHVEIAGPGAQFVEGPTPFFPFDPVRSIGVSALGYVIPQQMSYEFNVNNGQRSQVFRRVATEGETPNYDNRLAFYTRWQLAGGGTLGEFADEADLMWHKNFAWMLGVAAGYESQNPNASSFPSPQTGLTVQGLSSAPSPGFVPNYVVNGDLYRATVDWHGKYQGWGITATGYLEQVNSNDPFTNNFVRSYGSSTFVAGGFIQAGYFVVPKKLEVVALYGKLLTEGQPNEMDEYRVGLNYYINGHNLKIQTDLTYIPSEAAFTDPIASTVANTQDLIYHIQLQLKF